MKQYSPLNRAVKQRNQRYGMRVEGIRHNIRHLGLEGGDRLFGTPRQGRGASRQPVPQQYRGFNRYSMSGGGSYKKHRIPIKHEGEYVFSEVKE